MSLYSVKNNNIATVWIYGSLESTATFSLEAKEISV